MSIVVLMIMIGHRGGGGDDDADEGAPLHGCACPRDGAVLMKHLVFLGDARLHDGNNHGDVLHDVAGLHGDAILQGGVHDVSGHHGAHRHDTACLLDDATLQDGAGLQDGDALLHDVSGHHDGFRLDDACLRDDAALQDGAGLLNDVSDHHGAHRHDGAACLLNGAGLQDGAAIRDAFGPQVGACLGHDGAALYYDDDHQYDQILHSMFRRDFCHSERLVLVCSIACQHPNLQSYPNDCNQAQRTYPTAFAQVGPAIERSTSDRLINPFRQQISTSYAW